MTESSHDHFLICETWCWHHLWSVQGPIFTYVKQALWAACLAVMLLNEWGATVNFNFSGGSHTKPMLVFATHPHHYVWEMQPPPPKKKPIKNPKRTTIPLFSIHPSSSASSPAHFCPYFPISLIYYIYFDVWTHLFLTRQWKTRRRHR